MLPPGVPWGYSRLGRQWGQIHGGLKKQKEQSWVRAEKAETEGAGTRLRWALFAKIKTLDLILVVLGGMKVPEQEAGFEDISNMNKQQKA